MLILKKLPSKILARKKKPGASLTHGIYPMNFPENMNSTICVEIISFQYLNNLFFLRLTKKQAISTSISCSTGSIDFDRSM